MRKGFTIIELMVAVAIGMVLSLIGIEIMRHFSTLKKEQLSVSEFIKAIDADTTIMDYDLKMAGNGVTGYIPIEWNGTELTVRYVNVENSLCNGKTYQPGDTCSVKVVYKVDNNNLLRQVDYGEDGTIDSQTYLFGKLVKVNDFSVDIFCRPPTTISYKIDFDIKYPSAVKKYILEKVVLNRIINNCSALGSSGSTSTTTPSTGTTTTSTTPTTPSTGSGIIPPFFYLFQ